MVVVSVPGPDHCGGVVRQLWWCCQCRDLTTVVVLPVPGSDNRGGVVSARPEVNEDSLPVYDLSPLGLSVCCLNPDGSGTVVTSLQVV